MKNPFFIALMSGLAVADSAFAGIAGFKEAFPFQSGAVKAVKGKQNLFYRFVIPDQAFATEAEANVRDTPPGMVKLLRKQPEVE